MNKKIEFQLDDKDYCLEYDRDSIKYMEMRGFDIESIGKMPATMIEILFEGAFYKNHKSLKKAKISEIFKQLESKTELVNQLIEMVGETYNSLFDSDDEEGSETKNKNWKIV